MPIPQDIERILEFRRDGLTQSAIATAVGVSQGTISNILRLSGEEKARKRRTTVKKKVRQKLEIYFSAPQANLATLAASRLSEPSSLQILQECRLLLNRDPLSAQELIESTVELFEIQAARSKAPEAIRRSHCYQIQSRGLLAAYYRRSDQGRRAEDELLNCIEQSRDCRACQADLHRRLAIVQLNDERYTEALDNLEVSLSHYNSLQGPGHDLDGQPQEKVIAAKSTALLYSGSYSLAEEDAASALAKTPIESKGLRTHLLTVKAWAHLRLPGKFPPTLGVPLLADLAKARTILAELMTLWDFEDDESHSAARASAHWLAGVVDGLAGNRMAAYFKLGIAVDDFSAIGMPAEEVACSTDRARFAPNPTLTQTCLLSLRKRGAQLGRYARPVAYIQACSPHLLPHALAELRDFCTTY